MQTIQKATCLFTFFIHLIFIEAHREHKVHNIVLYPDKHSWCKTTSIKQVVTWPGCSSKELDNNVCVGACFSYMVPHSDPSAPGDLIRPYCDSCQPVDSVWHTVVLDCKDENNNPTTMQKKVQIITNCSCSSCENTKIQKPDYNSSIQTTLSPDVLDENVNEIDDTPDLLLNPHINTSKNSTTDGIQANERFNQIFKYLKEKKIDDSETKELIFTKFDDEIGLDELKQLFEKYKENEEHNKNHHHHGNKLEKIHKESQENNHENSHHPKLIIGPHHSLVLDSEVKEKIDVEPHHLQPAIPGQEISYQDNILLDKTKKLNSE